MAGDVSARLDAFKNRKRYPVLTRDVLAAIPDADLEQALLDHVIDRCFGGSDEAEQKAIRALPAGLRMVFATMVLEGDVNNGGFSQYFWNSSGRYADEALAGYRLLGAAKHAELTELAIRVHEQEKPVQDGFKKQNTLAAFSESYKHTSLGELDDRFYKLTENTSALRIAYIRAHTEQFVSGR